ENQLRKKEQELGAAEKMIAQLTQSKEALVTEHNELKTTLAELQSSTQVQTKDLDSLNQTIADLKTQIAQKESAIETLNKTLRQSTKEKEDILQSQRQEIQGLNRQITLLQAQSKANCAQEIQSLQAANQKDTDTINQLKRELQKAESEKTNALTKIDALTQELDSVRADRDSSLQKARQQTEELHNQIVSLQGEQTALKTQHARDMQTRQNRIDELEKESEAKNNLIASLQSKLDQYAQIVPEGQLRTQEKIYLKTKKLKGTINEYKDAYEQSQAELNDLERTYSQSAGKINDLQKKIKSLEQENLDLLKEAEALNKTIYSLGLGSELQRTKELTATRQERQEKQYARELKEYAAQVNDLRQTIGRYEVAVAELLTLLDTIEITDPRNTRQIHDLKKTLHTLQSNTW
ncbi:MAG: hypothetical protein JXD21_06715, partial [Candidatus Omnitrophica bacterium]|nr:hypothetical protein [Candidatus Omnitrophota bacterium]